MIRFDQDRAEAALTCRAASFSSFISFSLALVAATASSFAFLFSYEVFPAFGRKAFFTGCHCLPKYLELETWNPGRNWEVFIGAHAYHSCAFLVEGRPTQVQERKGPLLLTFWSMKCWADIEQWSGYSCVRTKVEGFILGRYWSSYTKWFVDRKYKIQAYKLSIAVRCRNFFFLVNLTDKRYWLAYQHQPYGWMDGWMHYCPLGTRYVL